MKTLIRATSLALLGMSLVIPLTACNSNAEPNASAAVAVAPAQPMQVARRAPPPKCHDCGTITGIEQMKVKGKGTGMGMVLGAVAGAVVGHQIGNGRGNDAATVVGAVGGGFAGNEIEKRAKGTTYFHVTVSMEDGNGTRTIDVEALNGLSNGSRVRVVGNSLQMMG